MRKEYIERSIAGLAEELRNALLLSTEHTYAESARILGIPVGLLIERVREARREVVVELLGEEWQDAESQYVIDIQIDAAAMRMQRRLNPEGVARRVHKWLKRRARETAALVTVIISWVFPDDVPTRVPSWRFAGAVGTLFLAGYLGYQLADLVGESDSRDGSTASVADGGTESGESTDMMDIFSASGAGTETDTERILDGNRRSSDAVPRLRVDQSLDRSVMEQRIAMEQRRSNVERRQASVSKIYTDAVGQFRAVERNCAENGWEFVRGTEAPDEAYMNQRLAELRQERNDLEKKRVELEDVREELKSLQKKIGREFPKKGPAYDRAFGMYLKDMGERYLDELEENYQDKMLEHLRKGNEYYTAYLGCAGVDSLDDLQTIPG